MIEQNIDYKTLRWGKNISPENMKLLREGEVFILLDKNGRSYSYVIMDIFGTIREKII